MDAKRRDLKANDGVAPKCISRSIAACMYVLGVKLHGSWPRLVWYPYGQPDCQDRGYRAYAIAQMTVTNPAPSAHGRQHASIANHIIEEKVLLQIF